MKLYFTKLSIFIFIIFHTNIINAQIVPQLPVTTKKVSYRIDVFAQLYLNEISKNKGANYKTQLPEKAFAGLNFYEGIKLAATDLNLMGYHIDLYIHDVLSLDHNPDSLINKNELDSSSLIIAAIPSNYLTTLAQFSQQKHINLISTLYPQDANINNNSFFTLLMPGLQTHCSFMQKIIKERLPNQQIFIYHRKTVPIDDNLYNSFTNKLTNKFIEIKADEYPVLSDLTRKFDSTTTNIIIMPILDVPFAENLLKQLSYGFPRYHFEIYGLPSWKAMNYLKSNNHKDNSIIYFTAPFYFDLSTASGKNLTEKYEDTYRSNKPSENVFRGYETLYWYTYLLDKYGTVFNGNYIDNATAIFTRFDIRPKYDKDKKFLYYENQHAYIYRYQGGSYSVE